MAEDIDYKIGTALGNMVTLTSLGLDPPDCVPVHYAEYREVGNAKVRGCGWLQAQWRWAHMDLDYQASLRPYCGGVSSEVYVKTVNSGGGTQVYSAVMVWPQIETYVGTDCSEDFVISFRAMVAAGT